MLYNISLNTARQKLAREYLRLIRKTQEELEALLFREGDLSINDLYKANRYEKLLKIFRKNVKELERSEKEIIKNSLQDMYVDNVRIVSREFDTIPLVDAKRPALKAINTTWAPDAKCWTTRIGIHGAELQQTLMQGLVDCVAAGRPHIEISKMIEKRYNVSFSQAERLVRTELSYVQNSSTYDRYKEAGIEYYELVTADDNRVCEECKELNPGPIPMKDKVVGENFPPLHPNCRCTIKPVIPEDWY